MCGSQRLKTDTRAEAESGRSGKGRRTALSFQWQELKRFVTASAWEWRARVQHCWKEATLHTWIFTLFGSAVLALPLHPSRRVYLVRTVEDFAKEEEQRQDHEAEGKEQGQPHFSFRELVNWLSQAWNHDLSTDSSVSERDVLLYWKVPKKEL